MPLSVSFYVRVFLTGKNKRISSRACIYALHLLNMCKDIFWAGIKMIFTIIRNRNEAREEFEKFISKSVEILAGDEMKMNIHKDKMLWYNTKYCIRTSDERSWNMGKDLKGKELGLWISTWLSFDTLVNQRFSYWTGIKSKDL